MTKSAIKKYTERLGFFGMILHYIGRFMTKTEQQVIGKLTVRFGKVKKNRLVFKNREMMDCTDNPEAFYEYLISSGYNKKYEIIWLVSEKRKFRRLKKFPPALVENRMLFETNDDFTDNGRALFDYLIEKGYNKKYEIVWLVHEPSKYKEYQFENVKFVQNFKKGSTIRRAEAYKYALTSKYIFYTQAFNWIGMSRRNQLFIDLWHGCGYKANKNGRKVFFDYCLVPGDIFIKTKMEFFGCTSKKLLSFGYPRYDMMLKGSERADEYKKKLLKETDSEKLILWMPTYRHASSEITSGRGTRLSYFLPSSFTKPSALSASCSTL